MPTPGRFSAPRTSTMPSPRTNPMETTFDFRGLDLTSPYDLIEKGRTPFAKNFRLYAEDADSRRIVVSSRKGPGSYFPPLNEAANVANTSTTGQVAKPLGMILNIRAMPFTTSSSGRLTKLELNLRTGTGTGPVRVEIYDDDSGRPGVLLADSAILSTAIGVSYAYAPAYFVEAPLLANATKYWIVAYIQDDGTDGYEWASNTSSTLSMVSNAGVSGLQATTYSLNFKTYLSPGYKDKGMFRFNQLNGVNRTIVAYQDTLYGVDDTTHQATVIETGLNTLATDYQFTTADGKLFWVNSYDKLRAWNGVYPTDSPNIITNGTFEVNTAGWTANGGTGAAIARTTSEFHTGTASLSVTATSGARGAVQTVAVAAYQGVLITAWVKGTLGQVVNIVLTGGATSSDYTLTGSWQQIQWRAPISTTALTAIKFNSPATNFFLDDVEMRLTGVETIEDPELPILSKVKMHKDRMFGVDASDANKLVFSENPGNPSDLSANQQWYHAWLSVSFIYAPAPKNAEPITAIQSFQDQLVVFTAINKFNLYGSDRASYSLKQAVGNKGALSQNGTFVDENYIYYVASDGFYRYNGSSDELISDKVQSEYDGCDFPELITIAKWKRQVRFYYAADSASYNNSCLLYHTTFEEWQKDTDVNVNRAVFFADGDDDRQLVESSSLVPAIYMAEQDYNSLGKPIDFAYWTKYDSLKGPAQRKRLLKYFPLIQGVGKPFVISLDMDKDFANAPVKNYVYLTALGAIWNEFDWGDGTTWGGDTSFKPQKLRFPGYAYYWQMRISRKAVNNPVMFFGVQYSYKAKRL